MEFQRITPCLWFDQQSEQAVDFYTSIFPRSRIVRLNHHDENSAKASGQPVGQVLAIEFELDGQRMTALNGGRHFKFNEAISLMVSCENQQEVDHYWSRLSSGGDEKAQQCGWLKDRYGVSWQIVPRILLELTNHPDPVKAGKAMKALLQMKKIDIAQLEAAVA